MVEKKPIDVDVAPLVPTEIESTKESLSSSSGLQTQYKKRKQNASLLASQYTKEKRAMEIVSITLFCVFLGLTLKNVWEIVTWNKSWVVLSSLALAMLLADLFSGFVHWGADTWGNLETPLMGKTFIRSFREHHVDPYRITVHDIIETNGDNCLLTLPALAVLSFYKLSPDNNSVLFIVSFIVSLAIWVSLTNQIHKWAHMIKPPKLVGFFQDVKIILSRKQHQVHHHNPFDRYYCITTGWMNPILASIAFWKRLEVLISYYFLYVPRQDDMFWTLQE